MTEIIEGRRLFKVTEIKRVKYWLRCLINPNVSPEDIVVAAEAIYTIGLISRRGGDRTRGTMVQAAESRFPEIEDDNI